MPPSEFRELGFSSRTVSAIETASHLSPILIDGLIVYRLFPDHLETLDGLFDYQLSHTTFYQGTLFRLPLRNRSHIHADCILQTTHTVDFVRDRVVRTYWKQAKQSLLFTKIRSISTFYRDASGQQLSGWYVT